MNNPSRPPPFTAFTAVELWNDPHISERMLAEHLDPHSPLASRPHAFIDRSVNWIIDVLNLSPGSAVLDLGCGPGLYAHRLARCGIQVLGIDASDRSVTHATEVAESEDLPASFRQGNCLSDDLGTGHNAAILIFEDYSALSPTQCCTLLRRIAHALKPGGMLAFDVTATARFFTYQESIVTERNLMDGFWASEPYVGTLETWVYHEETLVLEQYIIEAAQSTREFWNWTHCLTPENVAQELTESGFGSPALFGDVGGAAYDSTAPLFAVCAQRR